jgi:hypothetical protein
MDPEVNSIDNSSWLGIHFRLEEICLRLLLDSSGVEKVSAACAGRQICSLCKVATVRSHPMGCEKLQAGHWVAMCVGGFACE